MTSDAFMIASGAYFGLASVVLTPFVAKLMWENRESDRVWSEHYGRIDDAIREERNAARSRPQRRDSGSDGPGGTTGHVVPGIVVATSDA